MSHCVLRPARHVSSGLSYLLDTELRLGLGTELGLGFRPYSLVMAKIRIYLGQIFDRTMAYLPPSLGQADGSFSGTSF